MSSWVIAALPMLGMIIGAVLQHKLSRASEHIKSQQALRAQSYVALLGAIAGLAVARRARNGGMETEQLSKLIEAKARIVAYGDARVVAALAALDRSGSDLTKPQARSALVTLCQRIRTDNLQTAAIPDADVSCILLGGDERP